MCKFIETIDDHWSNQIFAYIMTGIFSLDNVYLAEKTRFLVKCMLFNYGDMLPETSKSSAIWDIGGNSSLNGCPCSVPMKLVSQTAPV